MLTWQLMDDCTLESEINLHMDFYGSYTEQASDQWSRFCGTELEEFSSSGAASSTLAFLAPEAAVTSLLSYATNHF
jgi:hypothetical protein